jgi:mono/diheme cytochrome c family protein
MKTLIVAIVVAALAGFAGAVLGVYNVAATEQHTAPVYWLLDFALKRSIEQRAEHISVPPLDDPTLVQRGFRLYRGGCVQCHGGPGEAPDPLGLGMLPAPAALAHTAREWKPAELYWVIKHGIKMTGMPAWKFRLPEDDLWAIVAFLHELPKLSPVEYLELSRRLGSLEIPAVQPPIDPTPGAGNPQRGKDAIQQYACVTCHKIPGVVGANAPVGPSLTRIGNRKYIAGVLPNTPENMVFFLRSPQEVDPLTAMPDLRVTERDAWDITAYLYTLQ